VGPRGGVDGCGKSRSHWDLISGLSSQYRMAIPTVLSWSPANNTASVLYLLYFTTLKDLITSFILAH
jgi:hypothetical protein